MTLTRDRGKIRQELSGRLYEDGRLLINLGQYEVGWPYWVCITPHLSYTNLKEITMAAMIRTGAAQGGKTAPKTPPTRSAAYDTVATAAASAAVAGKKLGKQALWLLRSTWKVASWFARKQPLVFGAIMAYSLWPEDEVEEVHKEVETTTGQTYPTVESLANAAVRDENVALALADAVNRRSGSATGVLDLIPAELAKGVSPAVKAGLETRFAQAAPLSKYELRDKHIPSKNEQAINNCRIVANFFGRYDVASLKRLHVAMNIFLAMPAAELDSVLRDMEASR
jgi:hypothetical protein